MGNPLDTSWNQELAGSPLTDDELAGLIDFSQLNEIFSEFLDMLGLPVGIVDLKGQVLASSPWQRVCLDFHRADSRTLARCIESDTRLAQEMSEGKEYALYQCRNGLTDCVTPIVVEGRHLANLVIGQFFVSEPDKVFFREQRKRFGFDEASYEAALSEVPIVDEERLPVVLAFVGGIARLVAAHSLAERQARMARRNVERQVEGRTAELAEVNEELERFAESISHDLKNPLDAMIGLIRLLESRYGGDLPDEGRNLLRHLSDTSRRMNRLITDLLDFSRARQGELTRAPIEMNHLVKEIIDELAPLWGERVVRIDVGDLPPTEGDAMLLRVVMTNLLANAVKYTGTRPAATIEVEGAIERDWLVYRVRDNGVGFDMKQADDLFTVFHRLHARADFDGTGVGLALARRIARRHGGDISIVAAPDKGATVTFFLPVSP